MAITGRDYSTTKVTWSTADKAGEINLSNNNLTIQTTAENIATRATQGISEGKWYWEVLLSTALNHVIGISDVNTSMTSAPLSSATIRTCNPGAGTLIPGVLAYTTAFVVGNVIGVALDMDIGTITFYKNGVSQGIAFSDLKTLGIVYPIAISYSTVSTVSTVNFGASAFSYSIPSGYRPLWPQELTQVSLGNMVTDLNNTKPGDMIPCRYTAISNTAGVFSELGVCVASEIPVTGTATPNGLFNFVKVSKGTWIADRVVQTGISWDALNIAKFIEGNNTVPPYGGNICIAGVPIENNHNTVYIPLNAFDTNTGTTWKSLEYNTDINGASWIGYDFLIPRHIRQIVLSQAIAPSAMSSIIVQSSSDKTNWITIETITPSTSVTTAQAFALPVSGSNQYWRLLANANCTLSNWIVSEVQMMESNNFTSNIHVKSLSGGNGYIDTYGTSTSVNANLGAYPPNNEWDTFIRLSDLDGKITAGDDNVWHWKLNGASWTQETPINSLNTYATRVYRSGPSLLTDLYTLASNSTSGFRPVLKYYEA